MIYFKNLKFRTHQDVYEPAEDSFLLAENLITGRGDFILDIGTGTGIQAIVAAEKVRRVLAIDINPWAIKLAKENAKLNGVENIEFWAGDFFECMKNDRVNTCAMGANEINGIPELFDLIVFNPPYLPVKMSDDQNTPTNPDNIRYIERAWSGGKNGTGIINRFIDNVSDYLKTGGRFELLISSLNNQDELKKRFKRNGIKFEIIAREKLWFEEIFVVMGQKI